MASSNGREGQENDKNDPNASTSSADSDSTFKNETESILRQFVYDRFEEETETEADEVPVSETARADALEELRSIGQENEPDSTAVRVSKKLREVGDVINLKYRDEFQDMISQLNITSLTAYSSFAEVAQRLFRNEITWSRIVALLCFGYEIAKQVLRDGLGGTYMRKIYQLFVDFIINERIAAWITQNGGWVRIFNTTSALISPPPLPPCNCPTELCLCNHVE